MGGGGRTKKKGNAGDDAKEWSEKIETISRQADTKSSSSEGFEQMAFFPEKMGAKM
jgi:hypothetical protein